MNTKVFIAINKDGEFFSYPCKKNDVQARLQLQALIKSQWPSSTLIAGVKASEKHPIVEVKLCQAGEGTDEQILVYGKYIRRIQEARLENKAG